MAKIPKLSTFWCNVFFGISYLATTIFGEEICYEQRVGTGDKKITCPDKCCGSYSKRSCCQGNDNAVIIGVVIGGGLVFIMLIVIIVLCCKSKKKTKVRSMRRNETRNDFENQHAYRMHPVYGQHGYPSAPPQYDLPPGYVGAQQPPAYNVPPQDYVAMDTGPPYMGAGSSNMEAGPLPQKY